MARLSQATVVTMSPWMINGYEASTEATKPQARMVGTCCDAAARSTRRRLVPATRRPLLRGRGLSPALRPTMVGGIEMESPDGELEGDGGGGGGGWSARIGRKARFRRREEIAAGSNEGQ